MAQFLHILAIFLALIVPTLAAQPFKALVAHISQSDTVFTITLNQKEKLVIDIESPLSWHHCPKSFPRVSCRARPCLAAQMNRPPSCQPPKIPPKVSLCKTCFTLPYNPITKSCALSELTYTNVLVSSTNGRNPLAMVNYNNIYMSCAPKSLIHTLPKGSSGLASLSKGPLSLVSQFSNSKVVKKFGMCLGDQGAAFFGDGPFYFLPPPPQGRDVTQFLSFTPLIKNPLDNLGYYIGLKGIAINGQGVNAIAKGGVKLSTVKRYTTLASHIYRAFISQFASATSGIPRVRKVGPFDLCINTTNVASTRVGLGVPQIDLQLSNGANWTIFGANSMIQTSNDVACLAFVNGGKKAKQGVVIGSYQMEHNFLQFDLVKSRLGFSSVLFFFQTTCNNFNFTSGLN